METRQPDSKQVIQRSSAIEGGLLEPKTPDLSLRRKDHVVAFKLPHLHHKDNEADDLPDITPELMNQLNSLWNIADVVEEQPVRVLVRALREHFDAINPYIEVLKNTQRSWVECWQFLYKIAQNLDQASEETMHTRFYSIPESLRLMEIRARMNLSKADTDWDAAKLEYTAEFDKRRQRLVGLQEKVKNISEAKDLASLLKYNVEFIDDQRKPNPDADSQKTTQKRGCLTCVYALFTPKTQPQPKPVVAVDRTQQDAQALQDLRAKLLTRYNEEVAFQTNLLNEFGEASPKKTDKYRQEWNEVKAKILHNQIDFYRGQTREVMLHCIRLYTLAVRTYYLVYGENPVADAKEPAAADPKHIKPNIDDRDKVVLKAKELFKQMIKGMKSQFNLFYCLQPDRCEFSTYLSNYVGIPKQEERDAILAGKATDEMLDKVFPGFEAPEDAFRLPVMGK